MRRARRLERDGRAVQAEDREVRSVSLPLGYEDALFVAKIVERSPGADAVAIDLAKKRKRDT